MTTANDTGRFKWIALAEQWIRYARSDLREAERLLDDDLVLYGVPCFHAQQTAEKALKASGDPVSREPT